MPQDVSRVFRITLYSTIPDRHSGLLCQVIPISSAGHVKITTKNIAVALSCLGYVALIIRSNVNVWELFHAEQHQDFYNNSVEVSSKKLNMIPICLFQCGLIPYGHGNLTSVADGR